MLEPMRRRAHDGGPNGCHNPKKTDRNFRRKAWRGARESAYSSNGCCWRVSPSLSATPFGAARAAWPERQITLIVCFPAGGGTDIAARLIGAPLGDALGGTGHRREPRRRRRQYRHHGGDARRPRTATRSWSAPALSWSIRACMPRRPMIRSRISRPSWCSAPRPTSLTVPAQSDDQDPARADRQGEGQSRQAQLDEPRRRHDALSGGRAPAAAHRHQDGAYPVRRRRPGAHGGARRPGRHVHRQSRLAAAA